MSSVLSASGLASGIDTASIVDKMVQLESQPITQMQSQQSALNVQVSALGDISSKLSALQSAAEALSTGGALGVSVNSSNTSFSAVAGSGALAGRYSVQVGSLATAASALSGPFASASAPVTGGTLQLTVMGQLYPPSGPLTVGDGTLADVAAAINGLGAPVSATILNTGSQSYLSITNLSTGTGPDPSTTLVIGGTLGTALAPTVTAANNAQVTINNLKFTRQTNTISDAIPGVTVALKSQGGAAEDLVMNNDTSATEKNLQTFASAYNALMKALNTQLNPGAGSDQSRSLAGNMSISTLKQSLQAITSTMVGSSSVRSLADLGFKTSKDDGTLSIDTTVLTSAISQNPLAVNAIFSDATNGIAQVVSSLVDRETDPASGILTVESQGLTSQAHGLDDTIAAAQRRIDTYRQGLEAQFAAMEQLIAGFKSTATFLTQASSQFGLVSTK
jgi:flagellar hook-associated protein 2